MTIARSNFGASHAAVLAAVVVGALGGCGSDAAAPQTATQSCTSDDLPQVPICDGSNRLTLRIFYYGIGRGLPGANVREEQGYTSFAVDGQCQYFLSGGWVTERGGRDDGWRHGALPDDVRRTLECEAGVEDLSSVYDCSGEQSFDATALVVANLGSSVACPAGSGGEATRALFTRVKQLAADLWPAGQLMDGGMRVVVTEGIDSSKRRYPWPDELDMRDYLQPITSDLLYEVGQSSLVPAPNAAPLRALREQYLRDVRNHPDYLQTGLPVSDGEVEGRLFMRDALPYEDERGLWGLPGD